MAGVRFIEHRGKKIMVMDIANVPDPAESIRLGREALALIMAQPPGSLLLLTSVGGARFNTEATEFMKRYSRAITPHVKASAITGVGGVMKIILKSLVKVSGRAISVFDTEQQALDWLAVQ